MGKSITEKLSLFHLKKIKRWMLCPACGGKMSINRAGTLWQCEDCKYKLTSQEFEDDYVFWFCDDCNSYLNIQDGFDKNQTKCICAVCGYENDISPNNIKGVCADCGKFLPDERKTLCVDCRWKRIEKAGKIMGAVAAVVGAVSLACKESDEESRPDEHSNWNSLDATDDDFPVCDSCGARMTEFDGCWWYTCPNCGNRVRSNDDGTQTWARDIFSAGSKSLNSDFELADFCRGGDLTED